MKKRRTLVLRTAPRPNSFCVQYLHESSLFLVLIIQFLIIFRVHSASHRVSILFFFIATQREGILRSLERRINM